MKSKMKTEEKLTDLLKQVAEIVPTIFFIGRTEDRHGVMFLNSPDKTDDMREADIVTAICMMIAERKDVRAMLFSAVCWYMQANPKYQEVMQEVLDNMQYMEVNPKYRDAMQEALNELKELDGHKRIVEPE